MTDSDILSTTVVTVGTNVVVEVLVTDIEGAIILEADAADVNVEQYVVAVEGAITIVEVPVDVTGHVLVLVLE